MASQLTRFERPLDSQVWSELTEPFRLMQSVLAQRQLEYCLPIRYLNPRKEVVSHDLCYF